jgi:NSS family neurotransmitter:Na+ symporter
MGAMITYGSYLSRQDSVPRAAAMVCILDTMIAFMACIIMFSIIFGVPEAERSATFSQSSTILFTTLPRLFYELPGGTFLSPVFYLLVAMAALTSTISLLEVVVAYFIDRLGFQRRLATLVVGGLIFALGVPTALSFGASDLLTEMFPIGSGAGFMNLFDYLATNWLLPVGGLLIAVFVGWFVKGEVTRAELEEGHGAFRNMHRLWQSALRFLVPIAVTWVLIAVIGGKTFN